MKKLSREQMKTVIGGVNIPIACSIGTSCSLVIIANGITSTWYGECGTTNGVCKCDTDAGNYTPTSNGGVSRCG